jgi:hypothetical protein
MYEFACIKKGFCYITDSSLKHFMPSKGQPACLGIAHIFLIFIVLYQSSEGKLKQRI